MRGGEGDDDDDDGDEKEEEEEGAGELEVEVEDTVTTFRLFLPAGVPVLLACLAPTLALRPLADTPGLI